MTNNTSVAEVHTLNPLFWNFLRQCLIHVIKGMWIGFYGMTHDRFKALPSEPWIGGCHPSFHCMSSCFSLELRSKITGLVFPCPLLCTFGLWLNFSHHLVGSLDALLLLQVGDCLLDRLLWKCGGLVMVSIVDSWLTVVGREVIRISWEWVLIDMVFFYVITIFCL